MNLYIKARTLDSIVLDKVFLGLPLRDLQMSIAKEQNRLYARPIKRRRIELSA